MNSLLRKALRDNRVERIQRSPLEPEEYCRRWSSHPENEHGYLSAWSDEIAKVTGYTKRAAEAWLTGYRVCPDSVKLTLRYRDVLNQMTKLLRSLDEIQE